MRKHRSERGFLSFGAIIVLLVLACGIFVAIKLLPPYINNYQLQDSINDIALRSTYSQITEEEIRKTVITGARDDGVNLLPQQVTVHKRGPTVEIAVKYSVSVDLLVSQVPLNFEPSSANKNVLAK